MAAFLKTLAVAVYERVILSYRSTLIGIALASGVLVLDATVAALQALPEGWAKIAASVLVLAGGFLKKKAAETAPTPAP
jgi:hypothetical protein